MSTSENRRRERFWNQLLDLIASGKVVPIVGEELLQVPQESGITMLYPELARRFAESCEISVEEELKGNLSAAVRRHPDFRDNPHDVYHDLTAEYEQWKPAIPEPLRALARIRHLNLFVSTTFDDLLEQAINEERFGGAKRTEVIAYSPKRIPRKEEIVQHLESGHPVVFQCFGNYRTPLEYALTEGDMVEYVHALQTAEYRPTRIFEELYERPLLLLGNSFPDWLTRMFLRMTRKNALDYREIPKQYLADDQLKHDPLLCFFLRNFTTNTELIEDLGPVPFISELSSKWVERFGKEDVTPTVSSAEPKPMPKNAVFISYCRANAEGAPSRDQKVATAIREALEARNVNVWFDQRALEGGNDYESKIKRYIKTCSIFMPIVSLTTEARREGYFRKEWNWAVERLDYFAGSDHEFLFPVVLDGVSFSHSKVPEKFKSFQYVRLTDEAVPAEFLGRVETLYRAAQGV
jgi:TIR domain/SIR2-like domain